VAEDFGYLALSVYTLRPAEGVMKIVNKFVDLASWVSQQDRDRPQRDKPAGKVCRSYAPGAEMGGGSTGC